MGEGGGGGRDNLVVYTRSDAYPDYLDFFWCWAAGIQGNIVIFAQDCQESSSIWFWYPPE